MNVLLSKLILAQKMTVRRNKIANNPCFMEWQVVGLNFGVNLKG